MSNYRRNYVEGGTFFFTVKLANPQSQLLVQHIDWLRQAYGNVQKYYPFETIAICVLPNHIHAIWQLPDGDTNYSVRWRMLKTYFSKNFQTVENRSVSKQKHHEKGIWQRRFYEHTIRNEQDLQRCVDYIYYNPVKHGWVKCVKDWTFSSFHRDVRMGMLPLDWGGTNQVNMMDWVE